jgi:high-affinity nickel-transport protein
MIPAQSRRVPGLLTQQTNLTTGPIAALAAIPLDYAGYAIAGLFVLAWAAALIVWRSARLEERWPMTGDSAPVE